MLDKYGIKHIQIRDERNPYFGGVNPEPIYKNLGKLIDTVVQNKADIGLATDGDADRVGAVDEKGEFIDSHRIYALLLRHLVEVKGLKGGVVKTFFNNQYGSYFSEQVRAQNLRNTDWF